MKRGRTNLIRATRAASVGVFFSAILGASAQQQSSTRVVDYVSPSLLSSQPTTPVKASLTGDAPAADREIVVKPRKITTPGDRWEEFEREFGVLERSPSWIVGTLQSAKYGLDKVTFTAKETVRRLEFTYDIGSRTGSGGTTPKPQYSLPLFGTFGQPQVKSVLTEHDPQTGTPFVGLKLAIPFGAGG